MGFVGVVEVKQEVRQEVKLEALSLNLWKEYQGLRLEEGEFGIHFAEPYLLKRQQKNRYQ